MPFEYFWDASFCLLLSVFLWESPLLASFMHLDAFVALICLLLISEQWVVVQLLSHVWIFATPWTAACQASLSFTVSWSLHRLMSIELIMTSSHLILSRPLLLLPSIFPSIGVFSNVSALCIRWPKYWSFSFSISPSNEYSGLIGLTSLQSNGRNPLIHSLPPLPFPASRPPSSQPVAFSPL